MNTNTNTQQTSSRWVAAAAAPKMGRKEPTGELSAPSEMPDNTAPRGRAGTQPQVTAVAGDTGDAARTESGPAVSNDQVAVPSCGNGSSLDEGAGLILLVPLLVHRGDPIVWTPHKPKSGMLPWKMPGLL